MDATSPDTVRIATANVRVPREEFLAVWREASRRQAEHADDAYAAAVAQTCRWIAAVPLRTALCGGLPRSPVTQRACVAREELIEAEWQAAQHEDRFSAAFAARPGWCEGVRATFRWVWRQEAAAPIAVPGPG